MKLTHSYRIRLSEDDLILSDGQTRIMESLQVKKEKANDMFTKLSENVNSIYEIQKREFTQDIIKPKF